MKKHFAALGLFVLTILFILPTSVFAYENQIESYDVDIKVNENNTLEIVETIGIYFDTYRHGIYRRIPLKNEIFRVDGTKASARVKISDIATTEEAAISNVSVNGKPYKQIKIGNAYRTVTGEQYYGIRYIYKIGKDTGKDYDELYFNIIGPEWEDAKISGISFTIEMPKEFDADKLGFSAGKVGSEGTPDVTYTIDGNTISGHYLGTLYTGQALTVRLELPDGYFVGTSDSFDFMTVLAILLPIVFLGITYLLWQKYGKDEKPVETVEFYPPKGFNSAEVGFLYKGKSESKDIVSLIVYLANKGYLKIVETEGMATNFYKKSFSLVKLKEYDGTNKNEQRFFEALFLYFPEVSEHDLKDRFYVTLDFIKENMNRKQNKDMIFQEGALAKRFVIALMIIASFVLITVKPVLEYGGMPELFLIIFLISICFLGVILFSKRSESLYQKIIFVSALLIYFGGFTKYGSAMFSIFSVLMIDSIYLITFIIGIICIIAMTVLLVFMSKRTAFGNEMLGKIGGFKNFLEVAEKPKLEALVMQDPSYFYNILPYTYVLGVSTKWIEKFETIISQPPDWYVGSGTFHMAHFNMFMSSTMSSATKAMSSQPSSNGSGGGFGGGGGFSGGGFSGGGFGGGGGGSW